MSVTIDTLPDPIAVIDAAGNLSPVQVNLNITGGTLAASFTYTATITYNDHGRNDQITKQGSSDSPSFSIDFGDVLGGTFELVASIPCNADDGSSTTVPYDSSTNVLGSNPSKDDVKNALGSPEIQVIAFQESKFAQFLGNGQPLFGPPNGFGIMQLDTPPPTGFQVWNWPANVQAGLILYNQKKADAEGYPGRTKQEFPNATDFTPDQLQMETWQRYNGGHYWKWDDPNQQWVRDAPNNYADIDATKSTISLVVAAPNHALGVWNKARKLAFWGFGNPRKAPRFKARTPPTLVTTGAKSLSLSSVSAICSVVWDKLQTAHKYMTPATMASNHNSSRWRFTLCRPFTHRL